MQCSVPRNYVAGVVSGSAAAIAYDDGTLMVSFTKCVADTLADHGCILNLLPYLLKVPRPPNIVVIAGRFA